MPGHADKLPRTQVGDGIAHFQHLRDALVSERKRPLKRRLTANNRDIEVTGGGCHRPHQSIVGRLDARIGDLLPAKLTWTQEYKLSHSNETIPEAQSRKATVI
jgi:hypothetical protein